MVLYHLVSENLWYLIGTFCTSTGTNKPSTKKDFFHMPCDSVYRINPYTDIRLITREYKSQPANSRASGTSPQENNVLLLKIKA